MIPISRGDETWVCVHQAGNSVSLVHMAGVSGFCEVGLNRFVLLVQHLFPSYKYKTLPYIGH